METTWEGAAFSSKSSLLWKKLPLEELHFHEFHPHQTPESRKSLVHIKMIYFQWKWFHKRALGNIEILEGKELKIP